MRSNAESRKCRPKQACVTGTCVMFDMPEFVSTVDESVVGEGNADSLTLRERVSILPIHGWSGTDHEFTWRAPAQTLVVRRKGV